MWTRKFPRGPHNNHSAGSTTFARWQPRKHTPASHRTSSAKHCVVWRGWQQGAIPQKESSETILGVCQNAQNWSSCNMGNDQLLDSLKQSVWHKSIVFVKYSAVQYSAQTTKNPIHMQSCHQVGQELNMLIKIWENAWWLMQNPESYYNIGHQNKLH